MRCQHSTPHLIEGDDNLEGALGTPYKTCIATQEQFDLHLIMMAAERLSGSIFRYHVRTEIRYREDQQVASSGFGVNDASDELFDMTKDGVIAMLAVLGSAVC